MNKWNNPRLSVCHADLHLPSLSSSFLVGQDGVIYEGVGWNVQGSRVPGYNDIALGIAFMGTFLGKWMLWAVAVIVWCLRESVSNGRQEHQTQGSLQCLHMLDLPSFRFVIWLSWVWPGVTPPTQTECPPWIYLLCTQPNVSLFWHPKHISDKGKNLCAYALLSFYHGNNVGTLTLFATALD